MIGRLSKSPFPEITLASTEVGGKPLRIYAKEGKIRATIFNDVVVAIRDFRLDIKLKDVNKVKHLLNNDCKFRLIGNNLYITPRARGGVNVDIDELEQLANDNPEIKANLIALLNLVSLEPNIHKKILLAKLASTNQSVDYSFIDEWTSKLDQFPTLQHLQTLQGDLVQNTSVSASKMAWLMYAAAYVAYLPEVTAATALAALLEGCGLGAWGYSEWFSSDSTQSILLQGSDEHKNNSAFKTAYQYIGTKDGKADVFEKDARSILDTASTPNKKIIRSILNVDVGANEEELKRGFLGDQLPKLIEDLKKLQNVRRNQTNESERRQKLADIAYQEQEANSGIKLASLIIGKFKPEAAKGFYSSMTAINKFYHSVCKFSVGGPVGWLTLAWEGSNAIDTFINVIIGTQSDDEKLFNAVKEVRDSIVAMHKDMNAGFTYLAKGQIAICNKLDLLFKEIRDLKNNLRTIQQELTSIKKDIDALRQEAKTRNIQTVLANFFIDKNTLINRIINNRNDSDIIDTLIKIFAHGIKAAKFEDLSSNRQWDPSGNFIPDDLAVGLERNFYPIAKTVCKLVPKVKIEDLLLDSTLATNPIEWTRAGLMIFYALSNKPHLINNQLVKDLIKEFWNAGIQCRVVANVAGSKEMVNLAVQPYRQSVNELMWKLDALYEPKIKALQAKRTQYNKTDPSIDKPIKDICEDPSDFFCLSRQTKKQLWIIIKYHIKYNCSKRDYA